MTNVVVTPGQTQRRCTEVSSEVMTSEIEVMTSGSEVMTI